MKRRRKPSRKAKAGPISLLDISESWLRKRAKAAGPKATPEQSAEMVRKFFIKPLLEIDERWRERELRMLRNAIDDVRIAKPANRKDGRKRRADVKFDLLLEILADIKPAPGLQPAEIEKKVLPEFRRRWAKLKPDDNTEPPVSRRHINRAYQLLLGDHRHRGGDRGDRRGGGGPAPTGGRSSK